MFISQSNISCKEGNIFRTKTVMYTIDLAASFFFQREEEVQTKERVNKARRKNAL